MKRLRYLVWVSAIQMLALSGWAQQIPDLAPIALIAPSSLSGPPRPDVTVVWGVTNQGLGSVSEQWADILYLSTNNVLDSSAVEVHWQWEYATVPRWSSYWRTNTLRLPATASGAYYLIFQADALNWLHEYDDGNNVRVAPIQLEIQPPDLGVLALQLPVAITSAPNPNLTVRYAVTNLGPGTAQADSPWGDALYLSTDDGFSEDDQCILQQLEWTTVWPGGKYWRTNNVIFPVVTNGTYYVIFRTDYDNTLWEANLDNNTLAVPITFTILPPDLVPIAQVPPVIDGPPYPFVTVVSGATNQGIGPALGSWEDSVYLSTNTSLQHASYISSVSVAGPVPAGTAYWQTNRIRLPVVADGDYFLIFRANSSWNVYESEPDNNQLAVPITVRIQPPDLAPAALLLANSITSPPNPEIALVWAITNQGGGAAVGNWDWSDRLSLSTNSVWDYTASWLTDNTEQGPFASGESYWRTNTFRLPVVRSGTWHFFLGTDIHNELIEANENNNRLAVTATFTIEPPDLVPLVSDIPREFTGPPNPRLSLSWGVTNLGPGLARSGSQTWCDGVYFSTDPVLDAEDAPLTGWDPRGPLPPGTAYRQTNAVVVPVVNSGTFYLLFRADRSDDVYEENKSNNVAAVPVRFTILPSDLVPQEVEVPAVITGPPMPAASIAWRVRNQGIGPAQMAWDPWVDALYLSADPTWDESDAYLLGVNEEGPLAPGHDYARTNTTRLPVVASTDLYLIFKTDCNNVIFESDEDNNTLLVPIRFEISSPDLAPLGLVVANNYIGPPNPTLDFAWGVTNQGPGAAEGWPFGSWVDRVYLSTNSIFDQSASFIAERSEYALLPAGSSYWRTNQFRVPVLQSGTYYLFFITDENRNVYESSFDNNLVSVPVSFTILPPDLAPLSLQVPATIDTTPNPVMTLSWGVTNRGAGVAQGSWRDILYVSRTPNVYYDTPVAYQQSEWGPIPPAGSYWRTNEVRIPVVESGSYYFIFKTDVDDTLEESDPANNTLVVPVTFQISPPDLVPFALEAPALVTSSVNPTITVAWGITNQGSGSTADQRWYDRISLYTAPPPESQGTELAVVAQSETLPPGGTGWATNTLRLPITRSGTYYLMVQANSSQEVYESSFENNGLWVPITFNILPADLAPVFFKAPAEVTGGLYPEVKLTWGVTNQGIGTAQGYNSWEDRVYLSTDPVLDLNDPLVAYSVETSAVTTGGNYWRTFRQTIPVTASGQYYFILSLDADRVLQDLNYSNNIAVAPVQLTFHRPDLLPLAFGLPATLDCSPNSELTLVWGITNQASDPATMPGYQQWCDRVFLSQYPNDTYGAPALASACDRSSLAPGESAWRTNMVRLHVAESGTYYFVFAADEGSAVAETSDANNLLSVPVFINVTKPDLAPIDLQAPAVVIGSAYPSISVVHTVTNCGTVAAIPDPYWWDTLFISRTNVLDGTESQVHWIPQTGAVPAGSSYTQTNTSRLPVFETGSYYLLLEANHNQALPEANYSNNLVTFGPFWIEVRPSDVSPVVRQVPALIDGGPHPYVPVVWGITNQGPGTASVPWWSFRGNIFLSTTPSSESGAIYLGWVDQTNALAPGQVSWFTNHLRFPPVTAGSFYLLFRVNWGNELHEVNTNNDLLAVPIQIVVNLPDLTPIAFLAPSIVTGPIDPPVELVWGVTNQGAGPATIPRWQDARRDALWLSTTTNFDNPVFVQRWDETNSVPAGGSYWRTNRVRLPVTESGTYYLKFVANDWGIVEETDSMNNAGICAINLDIRPPDLAPLGFHAPSVVSGMPNPEVTVVWGITNQGTGPALPPEPGPYQSPLADVVYLSSTPDGGFPWDWQSSGLWPRTAPVQPGVSEWHTNILRVPLAQSGTFHLTFRTDSYGVAKESNENNNTISVPVTFHLSPPPDLVPSALIIPRVVTGPGNPTITASWQVVNQGPGPLTGSWSDVLSVWGTEVGRFPETRTLLPGEGYWRTNTFVLPVTQSGDYQLLLLTGVGGPFDLDWQDNWIGRMITVNITGPAAVRIADPQLLPNGGFGLSVYGAIGAPYQLQASSDLVNWVRVLDFVCTNYPTSLIDSGAGAFEQRFYRIAPVAEPAALRLGFASQGWSASGLWLQLDGPLTKRFRVEASADLHTWATVTNLQTDVVPLNFVDPAALTFPQRFYRAIGDSP